MKTCRKVTTISGMMVLLLFFTVSAFSQSPTKFGLRTGVYTDAEDMFLGGEVLTPLSPHLYLNPNVEYVFMDGGTYLTFNADFHYDFRTNSPVYLWSGAGLAVLYLNPQGPADSNTDVGANILFGLGIKTAGRLVPYIQAKAILSDNNEVAIGVGLRF